MAATVHRFSDYTMMPWKNGRGETREFARFPADGGFAWRLSMATVSEDAAFSTFPGVTRTLAVVAGGELDLLVADESERMTVGGPARTFSGEAPASAAPVTATVTDLNLMVRAGFDGSIVPLDGGTVSAGTFIVALEDGFRAGAVILGALDTLELDEPLAGYEGRGYAVRIHSA